LRAPSEADDYWDLAVATCGQGQQGQQGQQSETPTQQIPWMPREVVWRKGDRRLSLLSLHVTSVVTGRQQPKGFDQLCSLHVEIVRVTEEAPVVVTRLLDALPGYALVQE
jgi:hypothetical protein